MKKIIIGAGCDLGVQTDGTRLGPQILIDELKKQNVEYISLLQDETIEKNRDHNNKRKNEIELDKFNTKLYETMVTQRENDYFPILLGGDHSVAVASALSAIKDEEKMGIIWVDAHSDYNTFETTKTGNIHGLPLAAITGYKCAELRNFHHGNTINPHNAVIIGARSIDKWEIGNIQDAGVTVFSSEDIKNEGPEAIVEKAFKIASNGTKGVHISYDIDVLDPHDAPGVSTPEINGLSEATALEVNELLLKHIKQICSYDLVEFNPLRDINNKTKNVAIKLINQVIKHVNEK